MWDGGNNDFPFFRPDLLITIADALRPRQIATHHPGETVARMADILVVNKVDSASLADVRIAEDELRAVNPFAPITRAALPIRLDDVAAVEGRRVLVIEDAPTITHGGMAFGAAYLAAKAAGARIVDPRPSAALEIRALFEAYPHIGDVLPAIGYGESQLRALGETIRSANVDLVVSGTPLDLNRVLAVDKNIVRVRYEFEEVREPRLSSLVNDFINRVLKGRKE